jgi:hypothetical protein
MISWLYRTNVFLLLCVLFRLTCHLQIFRFEGYKKFLEEYSSEVHVLLKEHMRIDHHLFVTSHRFQMFIPASLLTISIIQLISLVLMLAAASGINPINAGDLVVCFAVQLTGFFLCLVGATRITHRAQRNTCTLSPLTERIILQKPSTRLFRTGVQYYQSFLQNRI